MSRNEMPIIISGGTEEQRRLWLDDFSIKAFAQIIIVEHKGVSYGIEDVKEFKKALSLSRRDTETAIFYFPEAYLITDPAQQSMLTILEDLPPFTRVVLSVESPTQLLPTIQSRSAIFAVDSETSTTIDIATFSQLRTIKDAFLKAQEYTERQDVKELILSLMQYVRSHDNQSDLLRTLLKIYKSVATTTANPRLSSEYALLSLVRVQGDNKKG